MVITVGLRKLVHASIVLGVLLLPLFTWWQSLSLGGLALVGCALVLPGRPGHALIRGSDPRLPSAVMFYILGVMLLIVTFPARLDLVASGWGILAAGDGAATIAGRAWGRARWPWSSQKAIAGTIAFVVAGSIVGFLLAWALRSPAGGSIAMAATAAGAGAAAAVSAGPASLVFLASATLVAAIAAAIVETLPIRLDDNLSVSVTAALVLWCAALISPDTFAAAWPVLARTVPIGLLLNVAFAVFVWRAKGVSLSGAIAGAIVGVMTYAGADWRGWLMLVLAFAAAWATSRMGLARKRVLGIDEARDGRRGAENALANCGVAAVAALAVLFTPYRDLALLALTTALVAGASDTVASEIGKAWGGHTLLVTTMRSVKAGTPGAISLEGTAAGLASAFLMAVAAWGVGLIPADSLWIVVVAATAGAFVESALGATLETNHILDSHVLNFLNTLLAVAVAVWLR
jgi:uncharacterized protein (TIGR00297 family)